MTYAATLLLGYLAGRLHRRRLMRAQIRAAYRAGVNVERMMAVIRRENGEPELAMWAECGGRRV